MSGEHEDGSLLRGIGWALVIEAGLLALAVGLWRLVVGVAV